MRQRLVELDYQLDTILTGKAETFCRRPTTTQQLNPLSNYLGGAAYYLSDGGYSRIVIDLMAGTVFLTSNSLPTPKERWASADAQALVAEIKSICPMLVEGL